MEWQSGAANDDEQSGYTTDHAALPITPRLSANPWFTEPEQDQPAVTPKTWHDSDPSPSRRNANASTSAVPLPSSSPDDPLKQPKARNGHRKYRTADSAFAFSDINNNDSDATRPSLSRLTSAARLGNGLDRLGLSNVSTDSLSTQDEVANGSRRSLDELRKLSIKGKSRAVDAILGENSLQDEGREALLHRVEKGDSLIGIAVLYGCTAQAIRAANKLWLNDPIQLRKSLYIPLEACVQPPSKEYEFVQKAGENVLHLYHRQRSQSHDLTVPVSQRTHERTRSRMRSDSLLQAALSIDRPLTPYHDDSPSEQSSARSSFNLSRTALAPYLAETNSDYGDDASDRHSRTSDIGLSEAGSPPGSAGLPLAPSPVMQTFLVEKGTVQIVRMLASGGGQKGKGKGKTVDTRTVEEPLVAYVNEPSRSEQRSNSRDTIQAVSSGSLLTPTSSSDRLSALGAGSSASSSLRMRPRSPFEGAGVDPSISKTTVGFPLAQRGQGSSHQLASAALPPRTRKMSKDALPISSKTHAAVRPPDASKALSYFGQLLGNGNGTGSTGQAGRSWLGMSMTGFQDEIELAKAFQDNKSRRAESYGHQR